MNKVRKKLNINNLKFCHFPWILALVLIFLLTAGVVIYWQATSWTEKVVVGRVETEKLTLARSGALSISQFLRERETELLLLSEIESIKSLREEEGREKMEVLIDRIKDAPLADVVRVGSDGTALWVTNVEDNREGEGVSLADRDYFIWAKDQSGPGQVFVGKPVISRGGIVEGKWVAVMATPVFYQDRFNGLVFVSFPLEGLTEKFITPLVSLPATQALLITQDGFVVASTIPQITGENVLEYGQQEDWPRREEYLAITKKALEGEEGSAVHDYLLVANKKLIKTVTAYAPIRVDSQTWSLWITAPYKEGVKFASPISIAQSLGLVFGLIGASILILTFILGIRVAQRDAFVDGFRDGRDGIKKKN